MLERIRMLLEQVSRGDLAKLDDVDMEFEKLVKDGSETDLLSGMKLLEDFLFSHGQIAFEDDQKKAA